MKRIQLLFLVIGMVSSSVSVAQPGSTPALPDYDLTRLTRDVSEDLYKFYKNEYSDDPNLINDPEILKKMEGRDWNGQLRKKIASYDWSEEVKKKVLKLYANDYVMRPMEKLASESERMGLLKGIPAPGANSEANPGIYSRYRKMVEEKWNAKKREGGELIQQTKFRHGNEEALKQQYINDASKNAMIAGAGGSEKLGAMTDKQREEAMRKQVTQMTGTISSEELMKMTPEQQKAFAMKMASANTQNRGAQGAFTQELMANEAYRKRYEAMSTKDKEAEFKKFEQKYYGNTGKPVGDDKPASTQTAADQQRTKESKEVEKWTEEHNRQIKIDVERVASMALLYEHAYADNIRGIKNWADRVLKTLPVVRDSEYGPFQPGARLVHISVAIMEYNIKKIYLRQETEIWDRLMHIHVSALKRLDEFAAAYSKRKDISDEMKVILAGQMQQGYESVIEMCDKANHIVTAAISARDHYNLVMRR